ncbi:MAG: FAD-dependent oxidoreductase, partial [bacterium]
MVKNKTLLHRREFMGLTGTGAIGGTLEHSSERLYASQTRRNTETTRLQLAADVVVVGGGMAGVLASIAAARNGASVILVQDRSVLGGNASSEVRMHIVGADHHGNRPNEDARETGILEEIRLEDAMRNPRRSSSVFDLLLYEKVISEERITLLMNTHCYGAEMDVARIRAILASRHSTEDHFRIEGKVFIDCSGDGRLGAEAGAAVRAGRESRSEYGESLAPLEADRKTLGSSILIMARRHDRPMPFKAPDWIHHFTHPLPHRSIGSYEYGYWWNEWGGELDTIKDNEKIRHELQRTALGIWNLIKNSGYYKDSENWALEWVGAI